MGARARLDGQTRRGRARAAASQRARLGVQKRSAELFLRERVGQKLRQSGFRRGGSIHGRDRDGAQKAREMRVKREEAERGARLPRGGHRGEVRREQPRPRAKDLLDESALTQVFVSAERVERSHHVGVGRGRLAQQAATRTRISSGGWNVGAYHARAAGGTHLMSKARAAPAAGLVPRARARERARAGVCGASASRSRI